jgi:hypothetical protein
MFEEAGFTDLAVRYRGRYLFIAGHKPSLVIQETPAPEVGVERAAAGSIASV